MFILDLNLCILGNAWCAAVWLGNYNRNTNPVDFKDDEKIKEFIVAKVGDEDLV